MVNVTMAISIAVMRNLTRLIFMMATSFCAPYKISFID